MKKSLKKTPVFKNEAQEREFWENSDSTETLIGAKPKQSLFPT